MRIQFKYIIQIASVLMLLFIVAPMLGLIFTVKFPAMYETIKDKEVINSIRLTILISLIATLLSSIGAIPLAYLLARKNFIFKKFVLGIIDLPIVIPHSAAGIAILGVLSRDSLLGEFASKLGIDFIGNPIGIGIAMAFVSVPFLINSAKDGFISVPLEYEKMAQNLGASPLKVFFSVSLPLAKRNIFSGLIMMFSRGLSEFGAVVIIAYYPMVTPVLIFDRFNNFGLQYAKPAALLFIVVTLLLFIFLRYLSNKGLNAENK